MRRVDVEGFDVEDVEYLVDIVVRRAWRITLAVSLCECDDDTCVLAVWPLLPLQSTWRILYSTSLARAETTTSCRPAALRDYTMTCGVRD